MDPILSGLLIFVARVAHVSLGTIRTVMTVRGQKYVATAIGFVETLIFILAISNVLQNVDNVWNVLGYCGGFAAGTLVGLMIEEKLALGYVTVKAISPSPNESVAPALREAGYGATEILGTGLESSVHVVTTVVKRKNVSAVVALITQADKDAFITVEDTGRVLRGHLGPSQQG